MSTPIRKRILFVDDEPPVLNLLQTLFRHVNPEWEAGSTDRASKALSMMAERAFDIVVSDMRMPEMNGAELLEQVRNLYPRTARIVLSGYADQPMSLRALTAAHQYLSKPFTLATLQSALSRVFALEAYVNNPDLQTALGRLHLLPSTPSLSQRFSRELASPAATGDTLGGIIAQDPALSAKILNVVHSAYFGTPKPLLLAKEAATSLGIGLLRSIAVSNRLVLPTDDPVLGGLSLEHLARHGVATGLRASRILSLERATPDAIKSGFSAGVLHDIGRLALATAMPERHAEVMRQVQATEATLLQAEQAVFGVTHAQAGAYLLGLWGLPTPLVEIVAAHHEPRQVSRGGFGPLAAVHVANHLERASAGVPDAAYPALDQDYLQALRVDAQRFNSWVQVSAAE